MIRIESKGLREEQSAEDRYKDLTKEIGKQIKSLEARLGKHSYKFSKDKNNWGYAGDLGHVKDTLDELLSFFRAFS